MSGMGTSGILTGMMTFKTYYETVSGNAFPWGSEVELICTNDPTIIIPKFYVDTREPDENFTTWSCSDKVSRSDMDVSFEESSFTNDTISSDTVLSRCANACGFNGYSFAGGSIAAFSTIGSISRSLVENKTVREILEMYSTAMCGYWISFSEQLVFSPFGRAARGTTQNVHASVSDGSIKTFDTVIMYNGDEIYTAGNGAAKNTLIISTPLASQELCGYVLSQISDFAYKAWKCKKGLSTHYFYPGDIIFSDGETRFCTNVTMYPSVSGIFFSASANAVDENEYSYTNQVQRQLKRKLELDVRNGNMAITKEGLRFFTNKNTGGSSEENLTTVISVFRSGV